MLNVSKKVAYLVLAFSITIEILGDAALEACDGYKHIGLSIIAIFLILSSFFIFSKILHIIYIPVAYATWSSIGALASTIIGVFFFHQALTPIGWASVIVLAIGTFVLNAWGLPAEEASEGKEDKAC